MPNSNEITTEKEFLDYLSKEADSLNKTVNEARDFHYRQLSNCQQQHLNFLSKLGELSLLVGAAIGPVIIVSKTEISEPVYVFLALLIYLANGIFAIFKAKDITEKQVDAFAPGMLHKVESDVCPMQFSINKLITDPNNQEYAQEYIKEKMTFVDKNAEAELPKKYIDFSLDIVVFSFVIASLLLTRVIWPFNTNLYLVFVSAVILFVLGLLVKSFIEARERGIRNEFNTKRLNELHREHVEWQKRNRFKIKE